jgi:hypothetical protein
MERFSDEDPDDIQTMIEILAAERARVLETGRTREIIDFAATILCTLFDPIKMQIRTYPIRMRELRLSFRGIATDPGLQELFRDSLTPTLLRAEDAPSAIRRGVESLFRRPGRLPGSE